MGASELGGRRVRRLKCVPMLHVAKLHGDRDGYSTGTGNDNFPIFKDGLGFWDVPKYPVRDVSGIGNNH